MYELCRFQNERSPLSAQGDPGRTWHASSLRRSQFGAPGLELNTECLGSLVTVCTKQTKHLVYEISNNERTWANLSPSMVQTAEVIPFHNLQRGTCVSSLSWLGQEYLV